MGATKNQENIRRIINELGIIGEIVTVSPARTTQELTEMGIEKKYNTIVAVGSDSHINKVGTFLKNKNIVLGIIPVGGSEIIQKLIGTTETKEACEILKYRKLKEISLAAVEPNKYFLTQIEIQTSNSNPVSITVINPGMDSYHVQSTFSEMIISRNLYLFMTDKYLNYNFIKSAWSWLVGQKTIDNISSILRGKKIKIETNEPIPVTMDNEIIAKTPIVLTLYPKALKVITKPARMLSENDKSHKK
jgi:diacylglycerol kinase family enzyme